MPPPPDRIDYTNRPELVPLSAGPGGGQRFAPATFSAEWDLAGGQVLRATFKVADGAATLQTLSAEPAESPRAAVLGLADVVSDPEAMADAALQAATLTAGPTELVIRPFPLAVRSVQDDREQALRKAWTAYSRATREGRSTLQEIQEELGVSRSTATRMVRELRMRGDLPTKASSR